MVIKETLKEKHQKIHENRERRESGESYDEIWGTYQTYEMPQIEDEIIGGNVGGKDYLISGQTQTTTQS